MRCSGLISVRKNCGDRKSGEAAASELWKDYERHRAMQLAVLKNLRWISPAPPQLPCWTLELFSLDPELVRMNRRIRYRRAPSAFIIDHEDSRHFLCGEGAAENHPF